MKVLLTGANGFVGSHILEALRAREIPTVLLLRPTGNLRFIQDHLNHVDVRHGSVTDSDSVRRAMTGVTHVIHCAGATQALQKATFHSVNQGGTANVVAAVNLQAEHVRRLIHISSLAVSGPGTADTPARETDPPRPVTEYGRSKLAAEREVIDRCRSAFVILRPPGVYGPRDVQFLRLFRLAQHGWLPVIAGGAQPLSLVYVRDLATAVLACLDHPAAVGKTYHVAAPEIVTGLQVAECIARVMGCCGRRITVPPWFLRLSCLVAGLGARLSRRSSLLGHDKHRELLAPGWVCDPSRLRQDVGFECPIRLSAGIVSTLAWYREHGWLAPV